MKVDNFPWGIAEGKAFFDREIETKRLLANIDDNKHTLLVSPRRYGKSSLVKNTIKLTNLPYAEIDFFLVIDENSVESKILRGVRALIQKVSDTPEQWFSTLRNFFSNLNKKWTIGIAGISLELTPDSNSDIADNVLDALNALEHVLAKKNQKAIIFIDEFQEITKLTSGQAIEGAIRHFAQEAKYLVLIFSGSNRNILLDMFVERSRPLYKLCDRINLGRIDPSYYKKYLNQIALETWNVTISDDVFSAIISTTECHPNYVYILCSYIWRNFPTQQPSVQEVKDCWQTYVNELLKETREELAKLSIGQLKILIIISSGKYQEITGKEIQRKLDLTSSTIVYSIRILENMDYIERFAEHKFRIVNPVIRSTLNMFYTEVL